jgi:hypothetical protein
MCVYHNFASGSYLCFREMAIAASRRSVDDHIVILGWFAEEKKHEALSIELTNDSWLPRIELQGEKLCVGMSRIVSMRPC